MATEATRSDTAPAGGPITVDWYPPDDPVAAPGGWSPGTMEIPAGPVIDAPGSSIDGRELPVGWTAACAVVAMALIGGIVIANEGSAAGDVDRSVINSVAPARDSAASLSDSAVPPRGVTSPSREDESPSRGAADPAASNAYGLPDSTIHTVFLAALQDAGIAGDSDETYLSLADEVCSLFDEGFTFDEVSEIFVQSGASAAEAGSFTGLAAAAYCPQHNPSNW